MKHDLRITALLLLFFLASQLFGLYVISYDMKKAVNVETNQTVTQLSETAIGERPQLEGIGTIIYLTFAIFVGTMIILVLARFKSKKLWKLWFFLAIWMTISITLGVFFNSSLIYVVSFLIAVWKIFRPNFYIHNLSEILVYSGIAFLIVPMLNIFWGVVLLFIISLYDAFAVWQSKHMIKLAMFQKDSKLFAGLNINYSKRSKTKKAEPIKAKKIDKTVSKQKKSIRKSSAVLGGGDMAFPLIFAGTVLIFFFNLGFTKTASFFLTLPVVIFTTISLALLLYLGKEDRFYPAMPFISAGCFIGLGVSFLINYIL